jgi:hypothetical protein
MKTARIVLRKSGHAMLQIRTVRPVIPPRRVVKVLAVRQVQTRTVGPMIPPRRVVTVQVRHMILITLMPHRPVTIVQIVKIVKICVELLVSPTISKLRHTGYYLIT